MQLKDYELNDDKKYCYSDVTGEAVLKNKFGIKNKEELERVEREIVSFNTNMLIENEIKGKFDLEHLKKIHYGLFGDLYDWAGEVRTVNIKLKESFFCRFEFIENEANKLFEKLTNDNLLLTCSKNELIEKLAFYLGEINVLHPFREGNGRTQRMFIKYLANYNNYDLNYAKTTKEEMMEASILSYKGNYIKMAKIIKNCILTLS